MMTTRRSLLAVCASASLAGCLFGDASEPEGGAVGCDEVTHTPKTDSGVESATGSWPTAHFDTRNTGYAGGLSDVTGCPRTQWQYGTETGDDRVGSSAGAVVADGRAYHIGGDGTLHTVEAATGDVEWTTELRSDFGATPTLAGNTLYLAVEQYIQALDAGTVSERWHHETQQRYETVASATWDGTPKVVDDVVFVGSDGGQFRAHDAHTGDVRWRRQVPLPDPGAERTSVNNNAFTTPAVTNGMVYVGNANRTMFAFDAATGETIWRRDVAPVIDAPTVANDTVYVATANNLRAYDPATGEERWRLFDRAADAGGSPTLVGNTVYLTVRDPEAARNDGDRAFVAVDATDGTIRWRRALHVETAASAGSDTVYIASKGTLGALDATDGTTQWTMGAGTTIPQAPALADGLVYVTDKNGTLFCVG